MPAFNNGRPGIEWIRNFEKKWSYVFVKRKLEGLAYKRAKGLTQHNVDAFYMFEKLVIKDH